ncbi:unnamed protein product [Rhodiola kirilowii]
MVDISSPVEFMLGRWKKSYP